MDEWRDGGIERSFDILCRNPLTGPTSYICLHIPVIRATAGRPDRFYICFTKIEIMRRRTYLTLFLALFATAMYAQDGAATRKKQFNLDDDIAISGYDPVGYFKVGKAVKGKKEFSLTHQGVIYYFSSAENREEFKRHAAKYEPEYGGWCAYAMGAKGEKVSIDPETFKIVHGKLYLFYNSFFNNTLKSWNKDEAGLKSRADLNWKKIFH
jgi:YHS domain-containing protein